MDTDTPSLSSHLNVAQSLYVQRVGYINIDYVNSSIQVSIEKRLLFHLHVLSKKIDEDELLPNDDSELFVYISRRLLSSDKSKIEEVLSFSKEFFDEYPKPVGLIDALILFYSSEVNLLLNELFESNKSIRAVIITIWNICGQTISIGLLNQSELQHNDKKLQSAVLKYKTQQESIGLDPFKKYYRSLVENIHKEDLSSSVILASIWGGMLRKDESVKTAIRRAIELEKDGSEREKYLRLAAISGDTEFLPIFNSVAESKPEFGSYLISLMGTNESIKILFSMLQDPKISQLIIPAWRLITGQDLKIIPRISLVDSNTDKKSDSEINNDMPTIADINAAKFWVNKNANKWDKDSRYIHGEICNKDNLIKLSYLLSGEIAKDIFKLLALNLDDHINLTLQDWVSERYVKLDELS